MTFVPDRSIASGGVGANVTVTNFPADQLVHFTQPVDVDVLSMPTPLAVTGPLTDAQLAARLPLAVAGPLTAAELVALEPLAVSGPLTNAQLRAAAVDVGDGGGSLTVDGPLTAAELAAAEPLSVTGPATADDLAGLATEATVLRAADSLDDVGLTAVLARERMDAE